MEIMTWKESALRQHNLLDKCDVVAHIGPFQFMAYLNFEEISKLEKWLILKCKDHLKLQILIRNHALPKPKFSDIKSTKEYILSIGYPII